MELPLSLHYSSSFRRDETSQWAIIPLLMFPVGNFLTSGLRLQDSSGNLDDTQAVAWCRLNQVKFSNLRSLGARIFIGRGMGVALVQYCTDSCGQRVITVGQDVDGIHPRIPPLVLLSFQITVMVRYSSLIMSANYITSILITLSINFLSNLQHKTTYNTIDRK